MISNSEPRNAKEIPSMLVEPYLGYGFYIDFKHTHSQVICFFNPIQMLTHFMTLISFDTPSKYQKTRGFQMFSKVIKRDHWHKMG